MEPGFFGIEEVTEEDRAYGGSRFSEVREAVFANPYQKVWGSAGEPPWPIYSVRLPSALRGILPLGSPYFFRQAVARAVDSQADLRWGTGRKGFRRIIHLNGICLTGVREISQQLVIPGISKKTAGRS
jgi:hypothetical protein